MSVLQPFACLYWLPRADSRIVGSPPADWPILLIAVVSHLTSILVSYVVFHRLFALPGWIVSAMSFNSCVPSMPPIAEQKCS